MKKSLLILIIVLSCSLQLQAQKNEQIIDEKIIELLEITGAKKNVDQVITQILEYYKSYGLSEEEVDLFYDEIKKNNYQDFFDLLIPIYKKHYTLKEIDAIIDFYKSDVGQSVLTKTPLILQESMEIGYQWGEIIGEKISNYKDVEQEIIEE